MSDVLWVQVLQSKYFKDTTNGLQLRKLASKSAIWRGISAAWQTMILGSRVGIRDGQSTSFWLDRWLDSGDRLIDHALVPEEQIDLDASVFNLVQESGSSAGRGDDVLNWGEEPNGKFSIRSAYCLTLQFDHQPLDIDWKHVWRWKGPSRTQHFLWLAMHNKLMTNLERTRRHLTSNSLCPRCNNYEESTAHVLRDCVFAIATWSLLGVHTNGSAQKPLNKWLSDGMEHKDGMLFGISCWYLWKGRNELVFSAKIESPRDLAARISSWTESVASALDHDKTIGTQIPSRTAAIINWDPGPEGWITLNTDGSVNRATGVATIGGLLRNHLGFCSLAFTAKLGKCSITRAELRGIIQGLELAWNEGHKKVSVQTDSLAAVLLIRAEGAPSHQHTSEIIAIKNWTDRDWQVEFHHTYREANGAADFLATLGHNFAIGVHIIPTSDCNLGYFLRKDCMRIAELRSIPLIN
ncbi:Putative ribonuclease H protein At1g65750 [Linum perenne]